MTKKRPKLINGTIVNNIQNEFDLLLLHKRDLQDIFLKIKENSGTAVVFGGWVRDQIFSSLKSTKISSKDIDVVVGGIDRHCLKEILPVESSINMYGGISYAINADFSLDIWPIENTYLIAKENLPNEFEILPSTTVFKINSIIFKPKQFWHHADIIDDGCIRSIENGRLGFQSKIIPFPEIQVSRALIYASKFNLKLDQDIIQFIKSTCGCNEIRTRVKKGLNDYCPKGLIKTSTDLLDVILIRGSL